jgi:hypothetical protein
MKLVPKLMWIVQRETGAGDDFTIMFSSDGLKIDDGQVHVFGPYEIPDKLEDIVPSLKQLSDQLAQIIRDKRAERKMKPKPDPRIILQIHEGIDGLFSIQGTVGSKRFSLGFGRARSRDGAILDAFTFLERDVVSYELYKPGGPRWPQG